MVDAAPEGRTALASRRFDSTGRRRSKLAARHGVTLTLEEVTRRYSYSNFNGFLETFKWVTSFLRTPDDYALITRQLCEELLRQNVVYAEVTISAGVMLRRMQNLEANMTAIRDVAQSVPFSRLRTAFILDATRQFGPEPAMEVARWASKLQRLGVVAFGMGGDELAYPHDQFSRRRSTTRAAKACASSATPAKLAAQSP